MSSGRSQGLRGSLGDSWGDADYDSESNGGASVHSASDLDSEAGSESEFEFHEEEDTIPQEQPSFTTPLPSRVTRASSKTPQETPVKTSAGRPADTHSRTTPGSGPRSIKSLNSTPGSHSQSHLGPSFIMPSLNNPTDGSRNTTSNGSPLHSSGMRPRRVRMSQSGRSVNGPSPQAPRRGLRASSAQSRPAHRPNQADEDQGIWGYLNPLWQHILWPVLRYILSVLGMAMNHARPLIALSVTIGGAVLLLSLASMHIRNAVSLAITPLCVIPGSSYVIPMCGSSYTSYQESHSPAFEELGQVQGAFEDILDSSKSNHGLPSLIKNTEGSIRDLRTLVKYSKLPSRQELNAEFDSFIETARQASDDLTKYNSRIGYTLDQIISTNSWTLNVLHGIESDHASRGSLARLTAAINPLSVIWGPEPTIQQLVFDQYVIHVQQNIGSISDLIRQAEALLSVLNNLESRLDMIYNIAVRDGMKVNANRDELLSQLWTKLGNNKASRRDLDGQLVLLAKVHSYRNQAIQHVTNTLLKLKDIEAGLQHLREGVSAPQTLGYRAEIPLEYHIDVVGRQIDRMKVSRGEQIESERKHYRDVMGGGSGTERGIGRGDKEMPVVYASK